MDFARQRRRTAAGPNGLYYAALAAALFGLVFLAAMAGRAAAQGSSSSSSSSSGTGTATASGSSSSVSGTASAITASGTASASASSSASATRLPSNPATNTSPFPLQLATNQKPNCSSIGSACPAKSPCCRDGYCDSTPYFCGVNCEPLNSFSIRSCFARYPCFSYTDDFDSGKTRVINAADWDGDPLTAEWISIFQPDHAYINNSRLVLKVLKKPTNNAYGRPEGFGASVASSRWIQYGYITASIRTARGGGIVSSFIVGSNGGGGFGLWSRFGSNDSLLHSSSSTPCSLYLLFQPPLSSLGFTFFFQTRGSDGAPQTVEDEIDFEAVGKNLKGVYSNYFSYGDLVYTHGSTTDFTDDTSAGFHTYRIVWLPDYIQWVVDNRILRTVYKNQTWDEGCKCYKYPMREARVAFSVWDGGQGAEGTAWWAGGPTDWSKDPNDNYMMEVDWLVPFLSNPPSPPLFLT